MMDEGQMADVHQVIAKQEIHEVLMRFCRGIDRLDEALLRSCYHADSYDDHGHFKGNGQDFAAYIVKDLPERAHHTTHAVANVLIELDRFDPNLARTEAYVLACLRRRDEGGREWLDYFSGRYVDRFERRDRVWRIAVRVVVHDWSVSTALDAAAFPLPMGAFAQGCRDRSDPVYRI